MKHSQKDGLKNTQIKMSNYKFNVNTSGLTAYVEEEGMDLMIQLQMESDLAPYSEVVTGVKGTQRMHFLSTNATWQSDSCAYNASGTTTFTEKDVTVADIAIMEDICPKLLQGFWAQKELALGSRGEENIPAEISRLWVEKKLNIIKRDINISDWQGDTAGAGGSQLNKYNGLIKEIFADGSVVDGNTSDASTATSASNILARMEEMYLAIPEDLRAGAPDGSSLVWFLPQAYYDFYVIALRDANLFHFKGEEGELRYYGTDITLVPQVGLASQDKMVITPRENFVIATDLEADSTNMEVWYSKDDRINHSLIAFKRGITYKYSNYIVKWGLGTS